jgi:CubicO group peptidase (beta-lactamase class C family)
LPDLPHAGEVSLGNLISMTSGYRDFVPDPEFLKVNDTQPYKTWAPEEILPYGHLDLPLLYPPGTNWNYAHTNFVILGMALDKITGQPLNTVLQDKVLGPLGLTNTTDPGSPVIAEPALHAWDSEQRSVYNIPPSLPFYVDSTYWDTSWSLSKGAIQTTNIYDMDTTAIAVGNGKLLFPESFQAMTNTKMRDQGGPVVQPVFSRRRRVHLRHGCGDQGSLASPRPVGQRILGARGVPAVAEDRHLAGRHVR